ncbi:MAG: glycosyltransferase family 4 protein [Acidobacteriia bacterium]|nr:glycosyltransferase family 4 protein [Terriglobia bacterium]
MRVLFLDQFSDLGGAQLCLRDVLLEVSRLGWQAEVMAPGAGPLLDFARKRGFDVQRLPLAPYANGRKTATDVLRFGVDMVRSLRILRRALRERPADLIYVNGPRILPAVSGTHVPVVFHSHSFLDKQYARTIAGRVLLSLPARVLACSEFTAQPFKMLLRPDTVRVIYNGVSDHGFCPRNSSGDPVRVGILGRIAPEKGHLDFLRVAAAIPDRKKVQFCIVGASLFSDAEYQQRVRSTSAAAGVELRGWTDDVSRALHDLDILVVPSASHDASPRVILEALSAGTCVLSYPSGGIPELIRDGYSGLLSRSSSPQELAMLVRTLAANPELRDRLAVNGRREWEARFRVERFRSGVCAAISEAVTSRALGASGRYSTSPERVSAHDGRLSAP